MKKVLSIALAIVMVLSVSVVAFADDEVIWTEDHLFFNSGSWATQEIDDPDGFLEALQVEGAVLVVTRDAESPVTYWVEGEDGPYENFGLFESWYSTEDKVWLGTRGHTSADEPDKGIIDALSDDGTVATYDANAVYEAYVATGALDYGTPTFLINTSETNAYKVTNLSVIVPETTEEETTEEASTEETTEAAEETTESTETASSSSSSSSSPDTGVALALIPMAIAGIAVVSSKRR